MPRCRPTTRVGGLRVGVRLGRRRLAGRARPQTQPVDAADERLRGAPRLVEAAPRRRFWSYAELADELVGVRRRPRLHPRRADAGDGAPVRRLVGLPRDVVLRAGPRVRRPRRLPLPGRPAAPGRHRRDPRLGARPLRHRRVGAGAASTARRSTRTPTRSAAGTRSGAPTSSTSAAARCATSSSPTRVYWLEEFHADGLRVDGVASMLYLDYSREDGEWTPNIHGGRENLEAVQFLQEINATVYKRVPGIVTIAEESTSWPGVTRPTSRGGLGFGFKWNMGWMHDSLGYLAHDPVHRAYHHGQMTFSLIYAYSENYVLPLSPRRGRARQGLAAAQDARRPLAAAGQPARLPRLHVGAPRQAAAVHGHASSARSRSGPSAASSTGGCSTTPSTAACTTWSATSTRRTSTPPRCGAATRTRPASRGSTPTTPAATSSPSSAAAPATRPTSPASSNFAAVPHDDYRLGLPADGRWGEILNTDAEVYDGSGVGNLGVGDRASTGDWSGQPGVRRRSSCRRWRRCGSRKRLISRRRARDLVARPTRRLTPVTEPATIVTTVAEGVARITWTRRPRRSTSSATTWWPRSSTTPGSRRWSTPTTSGGQRVATWSGLRREGVMRGVTVDGDRSTGRLRPAGDRHPAQRAGGLPGAAQLVPAPQAGDQPDADPRHRTAGCCCAS